jgi:hypothetical protein
MRPLQMGTRPLVGCVRARSGSVPTLAPTLKSEVGPVVPGRPPLQHSMRRDGGVPNDTAQLAPWLGHNLAHRDPTRTKWLATFPRVSFAGGRPRS